MYYEDVKGNKIVLQDNGLILLTPKGGSTRIFTVEDIIDNMIAQCRREE